MKIFKKNNLRIVDETSDRIYTLKIRLKTFIFQVGGVSAECINDLYRAFSDKSSAHHYSYINPKSKVITVINLDMVEAFDIVPELPNE